MPETAKQKTSLVRPPAKSQSLAHQRSKNLQPQTSESEKVEGWVEAKLRQLSAIHDVQLLQLALHAHCYSWETFLLRAGCVHELLQRTARLKGGKGKRDLAGQGIQAQLKFLSKELGKNPTTLRTDARVYKQFFSTLEERLLAREHRLAREFYVIALAAPDPRAAIKIAIEKIGDQSFDRKKFSACARELKAPAAPRRGLNKAATESRTLQVELTSEAELKLSTVRRKYAAGSLVIVGSNKPTNMP